MKYKRIDLIYFLICTLVLIFLLFKNPFSSRTLIPNFEPSPDSFDYVTSARSFVQGKGLKLTRAEGVLESSVPPLYSLALVPGFLINLDARMFYFTNILLALFSAGIFFKILTKITDNTIIRFSVFFFYVTNYSIYWYPTLAMSENLLLLLFNLAVLLLFSPITPKRAFLAGLITTFFYATKYAALPLTIVFLSLFLIKIFFNFKHNNIRIFYGLIFLTGFLISFLPFYLYEYSRGVDLFETYKSLLQLINSFIHLSPDINSQVQDSSNKYSSGPWFSINYVSNNLPQYWQSIRGGPITFLWNNSPIFSMNIGFLGFIGLLAGVLVKPFKPLALNLLILSLTEIIFVSSFYTVDFRYIYFIIPVLLIGLAILFSVLLSFFQKNKLTKFYFLGLIIFFIIYLFMNGLRIKNQIMLNLKYTETPWYYITVLNLNTYFTKDKIINNKKPIVISAMSPYFIDYYSNGNYTLLPLSKEQEFRGRLVQVWGQNDYSDLLKLYKDDIDKGYSVYVTKYGVGNEGYLNDDYRYIGQAFNLEKVMDGCFSQCDIFKLNLK